MKITIVGPSYPLRGGISNFNIALARAMQNMGHEVNMVSFSMQYPNFLFPGKSQFDDGPAPDDLEIESTINSVNPFSWLSTAKSIKKRNPDVVVIAYWMPFMSPSLGTIARKLKKNKKCKVIAITHNVIPHEHHFYDGMLTKYFVNSCDAFIALANSVLQDLSNFTQNPNKIFIPHPIYNIFGDKTDKLLSKEKLGISSEKNILFFGLIRQYKGLDLLLEAMCDIRIKKLGLALVVAGEFYEDKQKYLDFINSNGLADSVKVNDEFIPNNDVKYYFSACDMVVQPYHTATQSGVTQIAYHFEKPMLVTNVGGLAEIVPHGIVGYVTEKSAKEIADSLIDFYNNNREDEFTKNISVEKNRFSWETMVNGILSLSEKITK